MGELNVSKSLQNSIPVTPQTEKPLHYKYIKEFRVEQCPLFLQHKCQQHRPFTCFHWHFMNQRRRRPVKKRDGTFNYSADVYCSKYDEAAGTCPDGDDCPFLHRTAGDTERRYHLRYFKTGMCVHDTDVRGHCVKNGSHCAFAHGAHDLRPPVYDIRELHALEGSEAESSTQGHNGSDKDRIAVNEDPKWQDTAYVLAYYKTEQCRRPPRLCRQGYACPQYHNSRDRRRSPKKYKYRSTPCPNAKHGDEWGEPTGCEQGDACQYCHTRTEQQFHPEIYKSTKCNDMQSSGYCPRGPFCAFAHVEQEIATARESAVPESSSLSDFFTSALKSQVGASNGVRKEDHGDKERQTSISSDDHENENGEHPASSVPTYSRTKSLEGQNNNYSMSCSLGEHTLSSFGFGPIMPPIGKPRSLSMSAAQTPPILGLTMEKEENELQEDGRNSRKSSLFSGSGGLGGLVPSLPSAPSPNMSRYFPSSSVDAIISNTFEDLSLEEPFSDSLSRDFDMEPTSLSESLTAGLTYSGLLSSSAPVNIPGSGLRVLGRGLSPSPPGGTGRGGSQLGLVTPFVSSQAQSVQESGLERSCLALRSLLHSEAKISNEIIRKAEHLFDGHRTSSLSGASFHDWSMLGTGSPVTNGNTPGRSLVNTTPSSLLSSLGNLGTSYNNTLEVQRLKDELENYRTKLASWVEGITQAHDACEAWKRECDQVNRKLFNCGQENQELSSRISSLECEVEQLRKRVPCGTELHDMPVSVLLKVQAQMRRELEECDKLIRKKNSADSFA